MFSHGVNGAVCVGSEERNGLGKYSIFFPLPFQSHWAKLEEGPRKKTQGPFGRQGLDEAQAWGRR